MDFNGKIFDFTHLNELYRDSRLANSSTTHHHDLVGLVEMGPVGHPLVLVQIVGCQYRTMSSTVTIFSTSWPRSRCLLRTWVGSDVEWGGQLLLARVRLTNSHTRCLLVIYLPAFSVNNTELRATLSDKRKLASWPEDQCRSPAGGLICLQFCSCCHTTLSSTNTTAHLSAISSLLSSYSPTTARSHHRWRKR